MDSEKLDSFSLVYYLSYKFRSPCVCIVKRGGCGRMGKWRSEKKSLSEKERGEGNQWTNTHTHTHREKKRRREAKAVSSSSSPLLSCVGFVVCEYTHHLLSPSGGVRNAHSHGAPLHFCQISILCVHLSLPSTLSLPYHLLWLLFAYFYFFFSK